VRVGRWAPSSASVCQSVSRSSSAPRRGAASAREGKRDIFPSRCFLLGANLLYSSNCGAGGRIEIFRFLEYTSRLSDQDLEYDTRCRCFPSTCYRVYQILLTSVDISGTNPRRPGGATWKRGLIMMTNNMNMYPTQVDLIRSGRRRFKEAKCLESQLHFHSLSLPLTGSLLNSACLIHPHHFISIAGIHPSHPLPSKRRSRARRCAQTPGQVPSRRPSNGSFILHSFYTDAVVHVPVNIQTYPYRHLTRGGLVSHHLGLTSVGLQHWDNQQSLGNRLG
jgi:hypothetical protein